jgi:putative ABC transport system permease protein
VNRFALQNLVRNRVRTALALFGLAGSTAGVVVLVALSLGARKLAAEVAEKTPGIFVMKAEALPHFSKIPARLEEPLRAVPGVAAVDPEIWVLAYSIEHGGAMLGAASMPALVGVDPVKHARLSRGGVYARNLLEGRMFEASEKRGALISRKLARHYKKVPGSALHVLDDDLTVTGIFETSSPVFDGVVVAHLDTVRAIADLRSSSVSCFFLEGEPGVDLEVLRKRVARVLPPTVEAGTTSDWSAGGTDFVSGLDALLAAIALVAGTLGALGVVNTMLMSVRERVRELGVLRATGWTRADAFRLVLTEAALLGAAGGAAGILVGTVAARIGGHFMPLTPAVPPLLLLVSFLGAVVLGALGGLYPAVAAARLEPMVAMRS